MVTYKKCKKKFRKTKKQMGKMNNPMGKMNNPMGKMNNPISLYAKHPLSEFIQRKDKDKYLLVFSSKNNHLIDLDNIYIKCFLEKMLEILRFSFEREKKYHINLGNYSPNYQHNISTIMTYLNSSNYFTVVATNNNLEPMSFLYIELRENDYDKMWTVCTDNKQRGKGFSSFVIENAIKEEKKRKRKRLLLEIYNDEIIERNKQEPKQNHIMNHFFKHGFKETNRSKLTSFTLNNLISNNNETKIMTLNL